MNKLKYVTPLTKTVELSIGVIIANSFIEGGQPGESGDADTKRRHPFSSENWHNH